MTHFTKRIKPTSWLYGYIFSYTNMLLLSLLFLWEPGLTTALNLEQCQVALGMENGEIPAESLTASSTYDFSVSAVNSRIRTEANGGAWCPKPQIARGVFEYLQIDLGKLKVITKIETQGRFGGGQGVEYAEQYKIEYQREDEGQWFQFQNRRGGDIFEGNSNPYVSVIKDIDPPIVAKRVRILPYSIVPKVVCMRVELYGCNWNDHLVSYDMPQGHKRGTGLDFYDWTYDAKIQDRMLKMGLGQLTDGNKGDSNFRLDPTNNGRRGYDWIGWKNETLEDNKPIEIVFKFDSLRNFTQIMIHCNNLFSKEVRVFRLAKIYTSIGGKFYNSDPIEFNYMRDTLIEYERTVVINMEHHIGRYVKIEFYFDSKWLLLSEIQFISELAVGNFTEETKPMPTKKPPLKKITPNNKNTQFKYGGVLTDQAKNNKKDNVINKGETDDEYNYDGDSVDDPNDDYDDYVSTTTPISEEIIGVIIGALAVLIIIFLVIFIVFFMRNRRSKYHNNNMKDKMEQNPYIVNGVTIAGMTNAAVKVTSNGYNFVTSADFDSDKEASVSGVCCNYTESDYTTGEVQNRKLPSLPKTPDSTDTNTSSRDYAVPDLSTLIVNSPGHRAVSKLNTLGRRNTAPRGGVGEGTNLLGYQPNIPHGNVPYGGSTTQPYSSSTLPSIQGVSGNNVYSAPQNLDLMWRDDSHLIEFDKDKLTFVEKLGEGQFGEVHLCEAGDVTNLIGDDFLVNRTGSKSMLVAVKMLRPDASQVARQDFHKEVKLMCQLRDPNIVQVLGVCNREDFLCVVVEYMKYGDLNQYLRQHLLEGVADDTSTLPVLSYGCLIYMANQIASGMKYLESLNMVHRDLASRNCLVGHQYTIKISDFGMSRSLYSSDYYRIEGKAVLPIRWMAWESVLLGKFSSKSDVWSFGVTLWEILNFAREQPFDEMTDEQVIENCGHFYKIDGQERYLPHPLYCPKEIYDLMCECWNHEEALRPAFKEIHMFLQRKNMGYNPKDEKQFFQSLPASFI